MFSMFFSSMVTVSIYSLGFDSDIDVVAITYLVSVLVGRRLEPRWRPLSVYHNFVAYFRLLYNAILKIVVKIKVDDSLFRETVSPVYYCTIPMRNNVSKCVRILAG